MAHTKRKNYLMLLLVRFKALDRTRHISLDLSLRPIQLGNISKPKVPFLKRGETFRTQTFSNPLTRLFEILKKKIKIKENIILLKLESGFI